MDKNQNTTKITFHEVQFADIKDWNVIKEKEEKSMHEEMKDDQGAGEAEDQLDDELLQFKDVPGESEISLNDSGIEEEEQKDSNVTTAAEPDPKRINASEMTPQESFRSSNLFKTFQPEVPKQDNSLRISKDSNIRDKSKFVKA